MQLLDWIGFGKVSAERDDLLSKYFFDNGVLNSIIQSPSSFLILGRKGAGKTAVFKYLLENHKTLIKSDDVLIPMSFEDYNWNIHSLLTNSTKAESMLYKQSWRFIVLVESVRALKTWFSASSQKAPKKIEAANKLLEKIFDSPIPSISQIVGRKLLSLSGLKLPSGGLDLESGSLDSVTLEAGEVSFEQVQQDNTLRGALSENIERLITLLDDALANIDASCPTIYICFDRVDEAWDGVSYETSKRVIAGLVSACDSISAQYGGKIRPMVFLREDIFDVLNINDANKLREDCGALLHWTKISLVSLILKRVNYFALANGVQAVTDIDSLFDKQEMRQRAKPMNYLLRRSMMRPRDMIAFLSRTIESMKESAIDPFSDETKVFNQIECDYIYAAEPGYSEWLKQEILDEWQVQKPVILMIFNAIQNHGSTNITKEILSEELVKLSPDYDRQNIIRDLRFLFDNSIIGIKIGASTEWKYKCFYPSQGFVDSDEYHIHDGLVRALNLTEPRDREQR
ncbi:P-loop ATPase, Sll1717 family [Pseudomonas umsongensis]|uniref:P-loop ATPase, Sll1717 family n=1 Tax=Pseudomonas umsongensis TaxID=198618 RepID=UPI00200B8815|nr:hypothetical protein [Pseudomonas umsongensis]MCK8687916.1 hypothetical protein [Pseudomonas umsongensis]